MSETRRKPPSSIRRLGNRIRVTAEYVRVFASPQKLKAHLSDPLYMNGYYLMASLSLTAVSGFAFWWIAAQRYSTYDVGLASAAISAMSLLAMFSTLGLGFGLIRFLPGAGDKSTKMINSCFTIDAVVSVIAAAVFVAGIPLWSKGLSESRGSFIWVAAFVLFTASYSISITADSVFIAKRTARTTFLKNAAAAIVKLAALILLSFVVEAFGIFASEGLASAAAMGLGLLWFLPRLIGGYRPLPAWHKDVVAEMLRYSLGTYLANLLWLAPTYLFPLLVLNTLGADTNALFYMAWAIAGVAFLVPNALSYSLFAEGSHDETGLRKNIRRTLLTSLLIGGLVAVAIFGLGETVLSLFGKNREYSVPEAVSLLRVLALSAAPLSVNYVFLAFYRVKKNIPMLLIISAATTGLSIGLSYVLMRELGLIGVGIGWTVGQSVVAAIIVVPLLILSKTPRDPAQRQGV